MNIPVPLGTTTYTLWCQTTDANGTPQTATTNAVTYKIYGPSSTSPLLSGSYGTTVIDSNTGLYRTATLSITSGNGFAAGTSYLVRNAYAYSGTNFVKTQYFTVT